MGFATLILVTGGGWGTGGPPGWTKAGRRERERVREREKERLASVKVDEALRFIKHKQHRHMYVELTRGPGNIFLFQGVFIPEREQFI